jgi:hypothetical protein
MIEKEDGLSKFLLPKKKSDEEKLLSLTYCWKQYKAELLEFLTSKEGKDFVKLKVWQKFVKTEEGLEFLDTEEGQQFLASTNGWVFLDTEEGKTYLGTEEGGKFLTSLNGQLYVISEQGRRFLITPHGAAIYISKEGIETFLHEFADVNSDGISELKLEEFWTPINVELAKSKDAKDSKQLALNMVDFISQTEKIPSVFLDPAKIGHITIQDEDSRSLTDLEIGKKFNDLSSDKVTVSMSSASTAQSWSSPGLTFGLDAASIRSTIWQIFLVSKPKFEVVVSRDGWKLVSEGEWKLAIPNPMSASNKFGNNKLKVVISQDAKEFVASDAWQIFINSPGGRLYKKSSSWSKIWNSGIGKWYEEYLKDQKLSDLIKNRRRTDIKRSRDSSEQTNK